MQEMELIHALSGKVTPSSASGRLRTRPGSILRRLVVDSPRSVGARARQQRWLRFQASFPAFGDLKVIDLGGTVETWRRAPVRPAHVTVLNLYEPGGPDEPWVRPVIGDACHARQVLADAGLPVEYDLVYSNSLIEHVGGHAKRAELTAEIRALAPRHWVQTPNRWFPIEPHWLFPLMQFLPFSWRVAVALHWPLVHTRPPSREQAVVEVSWTDLIDATQLRAYLPDSTVLRERVLGLTKSLTALQTSSAEPRTDDQA